MNEPTEACHGRLLLTDSGLALHRDGDLEEDERAFFATHSRYDHDQGLTTLLHWTLAEVGVRPHAARFTLLQALADGAGSSAFDPTRVVLGEAAGLSPR